MTAIQSLRRIRCWWRGYHVGEPAAIQYKFRFDVSGMCWDCGKVGSGEKWGAKVIAIAFWLVAGPALGIGILYVVGETVEHFTPEEAECPPFYQCTPKGDWNHPNCKCWDSK